MENKYKLVNCPKHVGDRITICGDYHKIVAIGKYYGLFDENRNMVWLLDCCTPLTKDSIEDILLYVVQTIDDIFYDNIKFNGIACFQKQKYDIAPGLKYEIEGNLYILVEGLSLWYLMDTDYCIRNHQHAKTKEGMVKYLDSVNATYIKGLS